MAGTQRFALLLLAPVNAVALLAGLAVAHGTVALPEPPQPLTAAAPVVLPDRLAPLQGTSAALEVRPQVVPSRAPVATAAPAPKATPGTKPARHPRRQARAPRLSFAEEVQRQVARLPLYRPGIARWEVVPDLAVYGVTRLRTRTVYLSPRIPRKLLYSVVAHEWGHVISTYAYGGDLRVSQQAFKEWYGGSMGTATERAADCIAVLLGATWTHYTGCRSDHWRLGALYLANGMKLPRES